MSWMKYGYDRLIAFAKAGLPTVSRFNDKLALGTIGRKLSWQILKDFKQDHRKRIWVHAASLGEFEQIVPVLEELDRKTWQVILTFFSPSGYEQKKNTPLADVACYLPLDTKENAQRLLQLTKPDLAIFVKYEFWPNYLDQLRNQKIPTILVSGVFRRDQPFFKPYGRWMTEYLSSFDHFFLQNDSSLELLGELGYKNASVTGDTRFDRAAALIKRDNILPTLESFCQGDHPTLVIGSSWPEDIAIIFKDGLPPESALKIIIAPHDVSDQKITSLTRTLKTDCLSWSQLANPEQPTAADQHKLASSDILIIDTIGLLTRAYSYADVAYVGGGMGSGGLHNILEAATFSVPVIIGKNYDKFPEAKKLRELGGLFSISDTEGFREILEKLITDKDFRNQTGMIGGHWIDANAGATKQVVKYIN